MNTISEMSKEEIENAIKSYGDELKSAVVNAIEPVTNWVVVDVIVGKVSSYIDLVLATDKTKRLELIHYNRDFANFKKGQMTTNVGAFGSFDMEDGNDVAEYYMGVGTLLTNKELLKYLKKILGEFSENIQSLYNSYHVFRVED